MSMFRPGIGLRPSTSNSNFSHLRSSSSSSSSSLSLDSVHGNGDLQDSPSTQSPSKKRSSSKSSSSSSNSSRAAPSTPIKKSTSSTPSISLHYPAFNTKDSSTSNGGGGQNVVVVVRVRPAPSDSTESISNIWNLNKHNNKITPTENHPSLSKRTTSSNPNSTNNISDSPSPSANTTSNLNSNSESETYNFQFDSLLLPTEDTVEAYEKQINPLVKASMEGYNATIFAYGQTGSGKTHTMMGSKQEPGIITRAVEDVWKGIEQDPSREFLLRVSYLEIYNETLKDLLAPLSLPSSSSSTDNRPSSPTKGGSSHFSSSPSNPSPSLRIVEDKSGKISITGLREEIVTSSQSVLELLEKGQSERHVGMTDWNERSSRSHTVLTVTIESRAKDVGEITEGKGKEVRISQLNLIDLAGSERAASQKERRKEGAFVSMKVKSFVLARRSGWLTLTVFLTLVSSLQINKSLLTLGTVIAKLTEPNPNSNDVHIPYRDSKLTRLLQTSLCGNARVAVVCTLSPLKIHAAESLSTLKFGRRCKLVVTKAKQGSIMDDKALIEKYRREVEKLKERLENGGLEKPGEREAEDDVEDDEEKKRALESWEVKRKEAEKDVEEMNGKKDELRRQIEHLTRLVVTSGSLAEEKKNGKSRSSLGGEEETSSNLLRTPNGRRGPRMSDMGLGSNASKSLFSNKLNSLEEDSSREVIGSRPFALESELASLRRDLANALEARQISESNRRQDSETWNEKIKELENEVKESEEELDLAQEAFQKLKKERDDSSVKIGDYQERIAQFEEDVRLLKLVKQSRDKREGVDEVLEEERRRFENQRKEMEGKWNNERRELEEKAEKESKEAQRLREELEESKNSTLDQETRSEFDQLVKGDDSEVKRLKEELKSKEEALRTRETELEKREANLKSSKPLPVPSRQNSGNSVTPLSNLSSASDSETWVLERKVAEREKRVSELEKELESTRQQLISKNQESSSSSANSSSSLPRSETLASKMETMVELQMTIDEQNLQISSLEKDLKEEKSKKKPLPIPSSNANAPHSPASPSKLRNSSVWSTDFEESSSPTFNTYNSPSKNRKALPIPGASLSRVSLGSDGLNRGGSLREYKKYNPTSDDVFSTSYKSRPSLFGGAGSEKDEASKFGSSLPTSSSSRYSLDLASHPFLSTSTSRGGAAGFVSESVIEEAVRSEREEISRLNAVISSQRALMSDLERSVAGWKNRLKIQQELIERLASEGMANGAAGLGVSFASTSSDISKKSRRSSTSRKEKKNTITPPMQDVGDRSLEDIDLNSTMNQKQNLHMTPRTSNRLECWNPSENSTFTSSSRTRGSSALPSSSYDKFNSLPSRNHPISKSSAPPSTSTGSSSPYYGAHTFNRVPNSPTKVSASSIFNHHASNSAYSPSLSKPDPLPLPSSSNSNINTSYESYDYDSPRLERKQSTTSILERKGSTNSLQIPQSPKKLKPRKTIENEMEMLRNRDGYGLKGVKDTRERLLDSPERKKSLNFDNLDLGGKRSKDYYI